MGEDGNSEVFRGEAFATAGVEKLRGGATTDYTELLKIDDIDAYIIFTIGYSQRFNPKFAYVRKSLHAGTLGKPVAAMVSRHITRGLGNKIGGRIKLSPAAMEATHDLDFVL
jgi:predicted dehydrogenase